MDNEEDCGHVIRAGDYGRHRNNDDVRDDLHQDSENAGGDHMADTASLKEILFRHSAEQCKFAKEQPYYPDAPKDLVSPSDLIKQQQEILARNGENQKKRERADHFKQSVLFLNQEVYAMREQLEKKESELKEAQNNLQIALTSAEGLQDESTAELEESIANIEEINRKVRANLDKDKAEEDSRTYQDQYTELTKKIESVRDEKTNLLNTADLPLPELSVKDGELVYKGQQWDNMSGSDRLKVSTAIVRKLNPKCGFVLLDKLEQMDLDTLHEFGQWLEQEGLQAIATRVSTGDECSIIIEDGYVKSEEAGNMDPEPQTAPTWKAGVF